ncbi:HDOD domain-containing protein [Ideonella oryzae]|uniref:HDOD domain-containing protein n=1 Tax=Ideonella oryzae TaxID=2937441 RepID=A0ABT1BLU6_9BURK|nr:HDOD domain-containing protein [Ideonella oryzae]MCO5976347.1 HDOD domain-containing protein [Ideonella oryzae]
MTGSPLSLERIQSCVETLPALPQAVREVMQALQRDDVSVERSVHLIEQDQALAARTLRVANSAFYGMSGRVGRIGDAVTLLGLRAVSGVLLAVSYSNGLDTSRCAGFNFRGYWRHSMAAAMAARLLAPRLRLDPDEGFVAGLLHDIGKLVLAAHFPAEGAQALALARSADVPDVEAERATLGLTHAQIGAVLVRHWRFPARVVQAVEYHAQPWEGGDPAARSLAELLQVANAIAHALDLADEAQEVVPSLDPALWLRLDLSDSAALTLLAEVERGVEDMCSALAL